MKEHFSGTTHNVENFYRSLVFYTPLYNFPFLHCKPVYALCVHKTMSSKEKQCLIQWMRPGPGDEVVREDIKKQMDGVTHFGDWWRQWSLWCIFRFLFLILPQHTFVDKCPCHFPGTSSLCLEPEAAKLGFGGSKDSDQSTGRKCVPKGRRFSWSKLCTWWRMKYRAMGELKPASS